MSIDSIQFGAEKANGKKKGYDFEQVAATAANIQGTLFNNIGNMLNGSMRPDTSQVSNSASNL